MSGDYAVRSIRYLYDGVRRVQEMTTDHLPDLFTLGMWPTTSGDAVVAAAQGQIDYLPLPLSLELRLVRGQLTAPSPPARQPITKHLTRQYIWGPGDRGLDELLVQFDGGTGLDGGKAWWPLQDAGLDLIALCDAGGIGIGSQLGTAGEARVVGQWTYDAYGRVLTADYPVLTANGQPALCHPKMGHKGLFVERLDESGANTGTSLISNLSSDPPTLVPRATSIVHMRNRWYRADLGRFLTVDPNASGVQLVERLKHGRSGAPTVAEFDLDSAMLDGANLYGYARGNPGLHGDEMGLSVDDDDDEDSDDFTPSLITPSLNWRQYVALPVRAVAWVAKVVMVATGTVRGGLEGLTTAYATNLELDIDWAMDWSEPDDNHSRTNNDWIAESFADGIGNGYEQTSEFVGGDPLDFGFGNPLMAMGAGGGKGRGIGGAGKSLTGQNHHAISRKIDRALADNPGTAGQYNRNEKQWMTRAATPKDHRGYQTWHRKYDDNAVKWIKEKKPSVHQFRAYMNRVYSRPAMRQRFPNGLGDTK